MKPEQVFDLRVIKYPFRADKDLLDAPPPQTRYPIPVMATLRKWLPEMLVLLLAGYFFLRELGTFPAAWADDSLFMIVARNVAAGKGYALSILGHDWAYPYILGVGPLLIWPVALAIKLFGFSVEVARSVMVIYLFATTITFYALAKSIAGRPAAFWATLLLVTLSAFVNTGKPVMGEVPAFLFLLLGLLTLPKVEKGSMLWTIVGGMFFGLAVMTKITYGLVYPALGIAGLVTLVRHDWRLFGRLILMGILALIPFIAWRMLEMSTQGGLMKEFLFLFQGNESVSGESIPYLLQTPKALLRLPYLSYGVFLLLGIFGSLKLSKKIPVISFTIIWALIALFTLYFLSSFGWYRHVLPAHLLLLIFVPIGAKSLFGKKLGVALLTAIILAQSYWQFDHRGANASTTAAEAAAFIEQNYPESPIVIQAAEVFVRLEPKPQRLFLTNPLLSQRIPTLYTEMTEAQKCLPLVRKLSEEQEKEFFGRLIPIAGDYFVIEADCR